LYNTPLTHYLTLPYIAQQAISRSEQKMAVRLSDLESTLRGELMHALPALPDNPMLALGNINPFNRSQTLTLSPNDSGNLDNSLLDTAFQKP
jgi:hypothetical protein